VQVPTLIACTLLSVILQIFVVVEVRTVTPLLCVVLTSAFGFAIESQGKSEIVKMFWALEIIKLLLTALAGL
jgi:hypothetical protein